MLAHWDIMPTTYLRQTTKYVLMSVYFVHEGDLVSKHKQKIYWMGVKIVPVADTTIKKQCTKFLVLRVAKDAQEENGAAVWVPPKNQTASIVVLANLVLTVLVLMRKPCASVVAEAPIQKKLEPMTPEIV